MKGKHVKIFITVLAVMFMASMAQAGDTIRIGWTADMPGVGATFYASQKKAIEMFIEQTNAAGGVLGKKLELVIRDSKLKPDVGATMARELILSEKCEFLIGPTSSGVALAVTKLGETNYAPYIPTLMAKKPEVIYTNLWGGGLSSFIKQAKPYGLFKKASITSLYDLDMLRATGMDMPEGLLGYSRCPFYAVNTLSMQVFVEQYHKKYNEWPSDWACMAYDGLIALTTAIKKADSAKSEDVVKVLGGLRFLSLRGPRYLRAQDHMADVGLYVGYTAKDPKYKGFLILKDVVVVPAQMVWLPVAEVKKLQP